MTEPASRFGFVAFAETCNGRLAMLGFVIRLGTKRRHRPGDPFPNRAALIAMGTDYTAVVTAVVLITVVLSAITVYVLSRPSDPAPRVR